MYCKAYLELWYNVAQRIEPVTTDGMKHEGSYVRTHVRLMEQPMENA